MAWSPLAGGSVFTGQSDKDVRIRAALRSVQEEIGAASIDEVMYAWLFTHPADIMPIVGAEKRTAFPPRCVHPRTNSAMISGSGFIPVSKVAIFHKQNKRPEAIFRAFVYVVCNV